MTISEAKMTSARKMLIVALMEEHDDTINMLTKLPLAHTTMPVGAMIPTN